MAALRMKSPSPSPIRYERQSPATAAASSKNTTTNSNNAHHPLPPSPARSKVPSSRRSVTPNSSRTPPRVSSNDDDSEPARVRVSIRVRPKNDEDLSDGDFYDCIELQSEVFKMLINKKHSITFPGCMLKRIKLRKNNWSSECYKFDEVFTESASQKRVYEVVAKPVVESVLNGYNGTVMAYGQTGTGKTFTVGRLGEEDPSECGIMVRAMKDILATSGSYSVEVSYLQLYMELVQDLLTPEKNNIPIAEDPKTGEVSLPGAAVVKIRDLDHCLHLLQIGEANRHAANTKLNTESSRSHAILMVYIQTTSQGKAEKENSSLERATKNDLRVRSDVSTLLKSKLLIVDLAGSERIDKSGSEGHMLEEAKFINLSLTSLGKCINALAKNSPHIPTRDSKLTRLLRDSFGGSARTSLIITIGPSAKNHAETASTIMFGQRAMKIVNMVKLKEEFDYESLCRKLESQVDYLTAELERQQKLREDDQVELEKKLRDCQNSFAEDEKSLAFRSEFLDKENTRLESEIRRMVGELKLQRDHNDLMHNEIARMEMSLKQSKQNHLEKSTYQKVLADTTQMYEKKIAELIEDLEDEHSRCESAQEQLNVMKKIQSDHQNSVQIQAQREIDELRMKLHKSCEQHEKTIKELQSLRTENEDLNLEKIHEQNEIDELRMRVQELHQLHEKSAKESQLLKKEKEELLLEKIQEQNEVDQLRMMLLEVQELHGNTINDFQSLQLEKETIYEEFHTLKERLSVVEKQRKYLQDENAKLLKHVPQNDGDSENRKPHMNGIISEMPSGLGTPMNLLKPHQPRETISGQRSTVAKIFEEVGLPKIVSMLSSDDLEVQIHAVKVVANLAAEDKNQDMIVEEGGIEALLMLLGTSENATIHRVASGAIANLAMNDLNQVLIMSKGGAQLLANIASKSDDPQTLRMVAGAIANLCGNQKLHVMLKEDGGIKALFRMVKSENSEVIAQVARGMANFAKCESRGTIHGHRKGRSLLLEDGVLSWLIANSTSTSASTRRHIELALCHLAQNEENAGDFILNGALKELVRISCQSSKEDIRSLAKKILKSNPTFQAEMPRV